MGAAFAARRAGMKQARAATARRTAAVEVKVQGSFGLTPNSRLVIHRVRKSAAPVPASIPTAVGISPALIASVEKARAALLETLDLTELA